MPLANIPLTMQRLLPLLSALRIPACSCCPQRHWPGMQCFFPVPWPLLVYRATLTWCGSCTWKPGVLTPWGTTGSSPPWLEVYAGPSGALPGRNCPLTPPSWRPYKVVWIPRTPSTEPSGQRASVLSTRSAGKEHWYQRVQGPVTPTSAYNVETCQCQTPLWYFAYVPPKPCNLQTGTLSYLYQPSKIPYYVQSLQSMPC